jgi:predicted patatin/cPLA2 family phospholipase
MSLIGLSFQILNKFLRHLPPTGKHTIQHNDLFSSTCQEIFKGEGSQKFNEFTIG